MPRPRQFDRDQALAAAVAVFWRQGYAATTTDDLARAMGVGRQSFYDTFGDKRRCYLEALRAYARDEVGAQLGLVRRVASPLATLRALLHAVAERPDAHRTLGCLAVNAVAEFGAGDPDVAAALGPSRLLLEQTVTHLLGEAKARGEVPASLDEAQAAGALLCTRMGLMLSAKAGRPPDELRRIADFAVDQLRPPRGLPAASPRPPNSRLTAG